MSDVSSTKSQIAPQPNQPKQAPDISFIAMVNLFQAQERKLEHIARQFEEEPAADPEIPLLDLQTEITNMAEFFACTTEAYFETPEMLSTHYPDVYERLLHFYGASPNR